jgi:hypothetical protein
VCTCVVRVCVRSCGTTCACCIWQIEVLDVYNNSMEGDVPASIRELGELRELYLANEHLLPLRMRYCGQRLPDVERPRSERDVALAAPPLSEPCSSSRECRWASTRGASSARSTTK